MICVMGAYVLRNRAGTRLKVLCVDAQGIWLSTRRPHEGSFHWPRKRPPASGLLRRDAYDAKGARRYLVLRKQEPANAGSLLLPG